MSDNNIIACVMMNSTDEDDTQKLKMNHRIIGTRNHKPLDICSMFSNFLLGCVFAGSLAARTITLSEKDDAYRYHIANTNAGEKIFLSDNKPPELDGYQDGDEIFLTTPDMKISAHYGKPSGQATAAHWYYNYENKGLTETFRWSDLSQIRAIRRNLGISFSPPSVHTVCKRMIKLLKAGRRVIQFISENPDLAAQDAYSAWKKGDALAQRYPQSNIKPPFVFLFKLYKSRLQKEEDKLQNKAQNDASKASLLRPKPAALKPAVQADLNRLVTKNMATLPAELHSTVAQYRKGSTEVPKDYSAYGYSYGADGSIAYA